MNKLIEKSVYVLDSHSQIWARPGYSGISYSDGDDFEQRIANIIEQASDTSVLSTELRQYCTDWPSQYHLSGTRANLLRPFAGSLTGDILEIGAGCGAITRYLGECGANVLALEGSPRRAAIARARTSELENVTVLAERFDSFQCEHKFDVITLIGVLEYANLFTPAENPALAMLQQVRSHLKPDGKLIIAIENQLGLKYFAGAPEDHLGQPMYGIEGLYKKDQPQTFGRKVLAGMLEQAGFLASEFLAPFPDYKLPVSILTEQGINNRNFDASAFAWQSVRRDPQLPPNCSFSLELAWPEIFKNGMALDLANSFLIIASPKNPLFSDTDTEVLAYHYSTDRVPEYCKETRFVVSANKKNIEVVYKRLGAALENGHVGEGQVIDFECPAIDRYSNGKAMSWEFIQIVTRDGWTIEEVGKFLQRYISVLEHLLAQAGLTLSFPSPDVRLPGKFFDLVPQNIIMSTDGSPVVIDTEWSLRGDVELGQLLFRGLLLMVGAITRFGQNATGRTFSRGEFVQSALAAAGYALTDKEFSRFIEIESIVQEQVTGRSAREFLTWWPRQHLPQHNLAQALAERDGQIVELHQAVAERDGPIDNLSQSLTEHESQIAGLHQTVAEHESQLAGLHQTVAEHDVPITNFSQSLTEHASQIASLHQTVAEHHGPIANLSQSLTEHESLIVGLHQAVAEHESQIAGLHQTVAEHDGQNVSLNQVIAERDTYIQKLISSKSWFITKPVRWVGRIVRGDFKAAMDPVRRALHLRNSVYVSSQVVVDLNPPQSSGRFVTVSPINPTHPAAVILPVYRGVEMTKRCILAAMPGILDIPSARIIAINDASPDMGMQEMLEQFATQWPNVFIVLKNEINLGFIGTVNRGFAYFPQHDAVLLNSDVIVPKGWLNRLIDEAYSRDHIGTVTPFSNNATICSFPHFLQENVQPFNLDVDSIDDVFRSAKLPCVDAPTGVGFCMYIRRACLDEIGYLNEEKFGKGYGEENDLCQRGLKKGWLNIISPNIYAYHEGGVSFLSEKQMLVDSAMKVIDNLHPNYHADIQTFIKNDPVRSARVARYVQLLSTIPIPKVLHVSHAAGGGVAQHVDELSQYFGQNVAHILLAPYGGEDGVTISLGIDQHADKLIFVIPSGYADLVKLLKAIGVSAVHYHHTQGLDPIILRLPTDLGVTHILTVHDFYWLNANPTLTNENGKYPGFYSETLLNPLYPLPPGLTPANWQERLRPLIESADCVIFPSNATKSLFDNVYRIDNSVVAPHIEAQLVIDRTPCTFTNKNSYTIGVVGAVGREKGADVLEEIAEKAKELGSALKFKLIGYAYRSLKVVETTGPYKTKELANLIHQHELDIVFFPAQCPETYSYTLSHALDSGLPIIAPNIGAFPERLSGRQNTLLFNHLSPATELLDQFNAFIDNISKGVPVTAPIFLGDKSKRDFYSCDYIPIVSRDLKIIKADKIVPFQLDSMQIVSGSMQKATWRDLLVGTLWRLYVNPSMRWVSYAIPYGVRRSIKRSLSRRSIHDITNSK